MQKQGLVQVCLNDTFCLILGQHNLASSFLFFSPPSQFLMHTRRHTHVSAKTVINFYQWQLPIGKIGLPTQRHHGLIINKLQIKKGLAVCLTHAITVHQSKESEHSLTVFLLRQVYIFTLKLNCWLQHYDIIQKGCATVKILLLVYKKNDDLVTSSSWLPKSDVNQTTSNISAVTQSVVAVWVKFHHRLIQLFSEPWGDMRRGVQTRKASDHALKNWTCRSVIFWSWSILGNLCLADIEAARVQKAYRKIMKIIMSEM